MAHDLIRGHDSRSRRPRPRSGLITAIASAHGRADAEEERKVVAASAAGLALVGVAVAAIGILLASTVNWNAVLGVDEGVAPAGGSKAAVRRDRGARRIRDRRIGRTSSDRPPAGRRRRYVAVGRNRASDSSDRCCLEGRRRTGRILHSHRGLGPVLGSAANSIWLFHTRPDLHPTLNAIDRRVMSRIMGIGFV